MSKFIFNIDHYFAKLFHNIYLWGGDTANTIFKMISWLADSGIIFLIIGLVLFLFKQTRKTGLTVLLALGLGFLFTNVILKNVISRARPFEDINSDFYKWWLDAGAEFEGSYSFPSGHTTATTAFSLAIFLTTNKERSYSILLLPIIMASSRIYLMVHYFSDCVGGIIVGLICASICYLFVKHIYKSKVKLFVFLREFTIFKGDENTSSKTTSNQSHSDTKDDYIYFTQTEEKKSANTEQVVNTDNSSSDIQDNK